ncbi:MAG: ATP-binding protein [Polyangiaceae bacterium]|nr:ATP-binding protein [Polyangiaceae bacterium]
MKTAPPPQLLPTSETSLLAARPAEGPSIAPRLRALETRVRLLRQIAACFTAKLSPEQVIEEAVQTLAQEFPEHRAAYGLIGAEGHLKWVYSAAFSRPTDSSSATADLSLAMEYLRALRSGAPVCVVDVNEDERMQPIRESCQSAGARAILEVPVRHSEDLLGVLSLVSAVPYRWTLEEQETLQEAAHQMTLLIQASRQQERRQLMEQELLQTSSRLQALMHSLDSAILFEDEARTIVYVNQAFCDLFGTPEPSLMLGGNSEAGTREYAKKFVDPEKFLVRAREVLLQGAPVTGDELNMSDGRVLERDYRPVQLDGRRAGHLWHYRDVSKKKQVQNQLAIGERMAALGTLAAGVAHEINNPLMYTISNVETVIRRLESLKAGQDAPAATPNWEALLEPLRDALLGGQRVRDVVRDLDALGREGRDVSGTISVNDVIESSVRMTRNEVRHRARLVMELKDVPGVSGTAGKLSQVVVNLMCNAAHAIPVGRAEENEVRVSSELDAEGRVVIRVTDTGRGIPHEIRKRIFEPFFTSKALGEGMGLGLAICHQIVADMGGEIAVDSELGVGTTFEVRLPANRARVPSIVAPKVERNTTGLRVLIVDDDMFVMRSLTRILREVHTVSTASSGRDALELLGRESFDVILCDLMMPNLSGMELYEILGDIDAGLQRRMVFVTGGAFSDSAHEFLVRTSQPVLRKPFQREELESLLARFQAELSASERVAPLELAGLNAE